MNQNIETSQSMGLALYYNPVTENASAIGANISAIQKHYAWLAVLDNDELCMNIIVENSTWKLKIWELTLEGGLPRLTNVRL